MSKTPSNGNGNGSGAVTTTVRSAAPDPQPLTRQFVEELERSGADVELIELAWRRLAAAGG